METEKCISDLINGSDTEISDVLSTISDSMNAERYVQRFESIRRDRLEQEIVRREIDRCTPPEQYIEPMSYHARMAQRYWQSTEGVEKTRLGNEMQAIYDSHLAWKSRADAIEVIFIREGIEWSRGLRSV